MDRKKFGVIFVLSVCLLIINSGVATARPVNLVDYFAVGVIGSDPNTTGQEWIYEYTSGPEGPPISRQFKVTLKGEVLDPATGFEHRVYTRQNQALDTFGVPIFDEATGDPVFEELIHPYLECNVDPKSISILSVNAETGETLTRPGFNISANNPISRVNSAKVFEDAHYAWALSFERGGWDAPIGSYSNYVEIIVFDKTIELAPGDNAYWFPYLDLPRGYENYLVLGYSYFAEGVGEIYHLEYSYEYVDIDPDDGVIDDVVRVPLGDGEYELVSTSTPASP